MKMVFNVLKAMSGRMRNKVRLSSRTEGDSTSSPTIIGAKPEIQACGRTNQPSNISDLKCNFEILFVFNMEEGLNWIARLPSPYLPQFFGIDHLLTIRGRERRGNIYVDMMMMMMMAVV